MPAGMKLTADTLLNGYDVFPVVFEADGSATVGGTLGQLTCIHADPKQKIASSFSQNAELIVSAPGQSIYWTPTVNRTAFAVADEVPFIPFL